MDDTAANADQLRRQMQRVREHLGDGVFRAATNVRVMTDWRYYVRAHPWAWLGTAAAVGYLLVPSRPRGASSAGFKPEADGTRANPAVARPGTAAVVVSSLVSMVARTLLSRGLSFLAARAATAASEKQSTGGSRINRQAGEPW